MQHRKAVQRCRPGRNLPGAQRLPTRWRTKCPAGASGFRCGTQPSSWGACPGCPGRMNSKSHTLHLFGLDRAKRRADPGADVHIAFRLQTFRGSIQIVVKAVFILQAYHSGTCSLWWYIDDFVVGELDVFDGHNRASGISSGAFPQGSLGRERPPQGVLRRCKLRHTPVPAPGSKTGGSLPSTSAFPVRARRSRECGRNCMSDKEIGEIGGVSQKASGM